MSKLSQQQSHRRNYNEPGHAHQLTFCCYHRFQFLSKPRTCHWLADAINASRVEYDYDLWAYVFMPEHVHLVIHPRQPEYEISDIRKAIKEPVGRRGISFIRRKAPHWLPKVTRIRGDRVERLFWQSGGGHDRNVTTGAALEGMIEYIHMNPVRRGLVERAQDWKWSSAAWYEDQSEVPIPLDPIPPEWLQIVIGRR